MIRESLSTTHRLKHTIEHEQQVPDQHQRNQSHLLTDEKSKLAMS